MTSLLTLLLGLTSLFPCNPFFRLSVGFYDDANILPCDTLLGISIYTLSFIVTPLFIAIFVWFISRIIETATNQLVSSRWYDAVASIVQKYTLENTHFEVRLVSPPLLTPSPLGLQKDFTFTERLFYSIQLEIRTQEKYIEDVLYWILVSVVSLLIHSIQYIVILPVYLLVTPIFFYLKRVSVLVFNFDLERSTKNINFVTGGTTSPLISSSLTHSVCLCLTSLPPSVP
jgi:hypothetical protein